MSATQRYFLRLAYHGGDFCGWQIQPNGVTVQQQLEEALATLLRQPVGMTGCGRTDTGVHATEFFAHVDFPADAKLPSCDQLRYKLNLLLPATIVVYEVFPVLPDIHARFSALSRTYRYQISQEKNPFAIGQAYFYHHALDMEAMNQAAEVMMTYRDFSCFSKSRTQVKTNLCQITHARWHREGALLIFTITADRFLRNMVRAIVGTMLEIGRGKLSLDDFKGVIEGKNRSDAGASVPPQGLFLSRIVYPEPFRSQDE